VTAKCRVLFFGEAVTLAHVARPHCLARALDKQVFEVHFACDKRFGFLRDDEQIRYWDIRSKTVEKFLNAVETGKALYNKHELIDYTNEDCELIRKVQPDLVVGDFRHSLSISTRLAQTPYVALINAYWSPYNADRALPVPEVRGVNLNGIPFMSRLMPTLSKAIFAFQGRALNGARRHFGLEPFATCRDGWTFGDHVVYYDAYDLIPLDRLPRNHHYIGPVSWSPSIALPEWWDALDADRKTAYVSLGSSGNVGLVDAIIDALLAEGVQVLLSSGGRFGHDPRDNVFVAAYLPGEAAARRADLVICNGGSPTAYQSLSQAAPVIGIPSNMDQLLAMRYIERFGAGVTLRAAQIRAGLLSTTVRRMLGDDGYRNRALKLSRLFAQTDPYQEFSALLRRLTGLAHA